MNRLLFVLLVLLSLVTVMTVGAFKLLGWWAVLVVPVVAILFLKFAANRLVKAIFSIPLKAKGAVLRGARSDVHSVTPTPRPAPEDDEEDDGYAGHNHFLVEVTITPPTDAGQGFTLWEPCGLQMASWRDPQTFNDDDRVDVLFGDVLQDGAWLRDEGMKYAGPQRLRLTVAAAPAVTRLQFQYYFEAFGDVALPRVIAASATRLAELGESRDR